VTDDTVPARTRKTNGPKLVRYLQSRTGQLLVIPDIADDLGMPRSSVYTVLNRLKGTPGLTRPGQTLVRYDPHPGAPPLADPSTKPEHGTPAPASHAEGAAAHPPPVAAAPAQPAQVRIQPGDIVSLRVLRVAGDVTIARGMIDDHGMYLLERIPF